MGTVGLAYLVGIVPMILALVGFGRLGQTETLWGAAAVAPVLAGMFLGERLRGRFSETTLDPTNIMNPGNMLQPHN